MTLNYTGQFFEIDDIRACIDHMSPTSKLTKMSDADFVSFMVESDRYAFLTVTETSGYFTHYLIQQSIKLSQLPSWVESAHAFFVSYYEYLMKPSNMQYLNKILFHLSNAPQDVMRKRRYYYMAFKESANSFKPNEALDYYAQYLQNDLDEFETPPTLDLIEEYTLLGRIYSEKLDSSKSNNYFIEALKVSGFKVPTTLFHARWKSWRLLSKIPTILQLDKTQRRVCCLTLLHGLFPAVFRGLNNTPKTRLNALQLLLNLLKDIRLGFLRTVPTHMSLMCSSLLYFISVAADWTDISLVFLSASLSEFRMIGMMKIAARIEPVIMNMLSNVNTSSPDGIDMFESLARNAASLDRIDKVGDYLWKLVERCVDFGVGGSTYCHHERILSLVAKDM
jgi:tetratricopeptide (TPR) repeat protein